MSKKPTVLMILDGFGLNDKQNANAVYERKNSQKPIYNTTLQVKMQALFFINTNLCNVSL